MILRLHPLYRKFLLLVLVAGPFFWLVFTQDGQRRTDLVLLWLTGKPEVNLAVERLNGDMRESDLRSVFPDLKLRCQSAVSPFGDRVCGAEIGAFDRIPARALTLFMDGDRLRVVKVSYRRAYQNALLQQLQARLGAPGHRPDTGGPRPVASWTVSGGVLLMPAGRLQLDEEAALLWVSQAVVQRGVALQRSSPAAAEAPASDRSETPTH